MRGLVLRCRGDKDMSILRRCVGFAKMGVCYFTGRRVSAKDFAEEYDRVASTYDLWTQRMGPHTDLLLDLDLLPKRDRPLRIIDLACGTGYIARSLLSKLGAGCEASITCTDISRGMLDRARESICDDRVDFVEAEGMEFLASLPPGSCDAIYCGWGMVYFPCARLIPLCAAALQPDGILGSIMNCMGTLRGVEDLFIEVMSEHPNEVDKIMDTRFHLPANEAAFNSWFTRHGFKPTLSGSGEQIVLWLTPELLYAWLRDTGAIAGTAKLFRDEQEMAPILIERAAKRCAVHGGYRTNHKFVYGVYNKCP